MSAEECIAQLKARHQGMRVLVAEDEAIIRLDLVETLREAGYDVVAAVGDGAKAVELAGTLAEIARHTLADEFRRFDSHEARVLLLEGSPRVLAAFPEAL